MAETAALLADDVLPLRPLRQWVLSLPFALRFLLATDPNSLARILGTVYRAISGFLLHKTGLTRATGFPGAVILIQRFGTALNLNRTTGPSSDAVLRWRGSSHLTARQSPWRISNWPTAFASGNSRSGVGVSGAACR